MASVEVRNLSKSFGKVEAVRSVTLDIEDREFVVIVGPSGCGKSTLLRMIAGLETIDSGALSIGGKPMNEVNAADRGVAMVFQSYALYPHMSVRENIGFGLKMAGMPVDRVAAKVTEAVGTLQIADLLDRRPRELSGGQRQRVAIGRAIVKEPDVFLFDEPLSNLDAGLRAQMRIEIARLHAEVRSTVIYVTHDQVEAMTLADRIVILNNGRIEQIGTPDELYDRPANVFVAGFLGQPRMNFIPAVVGSGMGEGAGLPLDIADGARIVGPILARPPSAGVAVTLGLRPDSIRLDRKAMAKDPVGTVEVSEHLGNETLVHVRMSGVDQLITVTQPKRSSIGAGDTVALTSDPAEAHVFDANGERIV